MPEIVTANRMSDGNVVYFTATGGWSERLRDGAIADTEAQAQALLDRAGASEEILHIVDPYLMKVQYTNGKTEPVGQRETIRSKGPTTHLNFGKQAEEGQSHV